MDVPGSCNYHDAIMSFYPMIRAFIISLQTGAGANMRFADPIFSNYKTYSGRQGISAVYCKYIPVSDHSGADHADTGNSSGTASE